MSSSARRKAETIHQIELAISTFLHDLASSTTPANLSFQLTPNTRPIPLASASPRDTRRLAIVLRILELIHAGLLSSTVSTKRDIYYKDPSLFGNQQVVDRVVDHLAACLSTTRAGLNVAAAAKGLVAGDFDVRKRDGAEVKWRIGEAARLVPVLEEWDVLDMNVDERGSVLDWVLVIEKEATFSALVSAEFIARPGLGRGIMITGKGYPDLSTRAFLRRLSMSYPRESKPPALLALVDHDPDGIAIMSTYKHGSEALSHENNDLVVPQLQWLGVKREDLMSVGSCFGGDGGTDPERGLLRLTQRDRAKAIAMLEKGVCSEDGVEVGWRAELQAMLMTNIKAEIQLLDGRAGGLIGWLASRLATCGVPVVDEDDMMLV